MRTRTISFQNLIEAIGANGSFRWKAAIGLPRFQLAAAPGRSETAMAVGARLATSEVAKTRSRGGKAASLTLRSVSALVPMGRAWCCALWASGGSLRSLPHPPAGEPRPSDLAKTGVLLAPFRSCGRVPFGGS